MLKGDFGRRTLFSGVREQARDKVLAILRNRLPDAVVEVVGALTHLLHDVLVGLTVERWHAREENVSNDATGPDIALLVVVLVEDFRCDIIRRAKLLVEVAVWIVDEGRAEINDLDLVVLLVLLEQDILGLQITMHNVVLVTVVQSIQDLSEDPSSHFLTEVLLFDDTVEQLASRAQPI